MNTNIKLMSPLSGCPIPEVSQQNQSLIVNELFISPTSASVPLSQIERNRPYFICHKTAGNWGEAGVYFYPQSIKASTNEPDPIWVSSPLIVQARTRDKDSDSWGRLLVWTDPDGHEKLWEMPDSLLMGELNALLSPLAKGGLDIDISNRKYLLQYLQSQKPDLRMTSVIKHGWVEPGVYVSDNFVVNSANNFTYILQSDLRREESWMRGTLEEWRKNVASLCIDNSRLMFSVACAFSGPLLEPCAFNGGGFHFQGSSSIGKSLTMWLAASVINSPQQIITSWRATDNGLEGVASKSCDSLLMLDELGQVDGRKAGDIAYMLGNGKGKTRATKDGSARDVSVWRLMFLSNGEIDLATHMEAGGKHRMAGQDLRMMTIPADAGAGFGIFENLHGSVSSRDFAERVKKSSEQYFGTALEPFIKYVAANWNDISLNGKSTVREFVTAVVPKGADGQISRAAERFGIVAFAGELASCIGITGWKQGQSNNAAKVCFLSWLSIRDGIASSEEYEVLERLRKVFLFDSARFESLHTAHLQEQSFVNNRLGFISDSLYDIPVPGFNEIMKGLDVKLAASVLKKHNIISHDIGAGLPRKKLPGLSRTRCYTIDSTKLPD